MIENNSKISLSYQVTGEYLVKRGKYSSAKIKFGKNIVKYDCGQEGPEVIIENPSQVIEKPEFADSHISVILPEAFIERALELPKCSARKGSDEYHRWFRSDMGKLLLDWKKLNDIQKIERHIEIYVKDITRNPNPIRGRDYKFEII